MNRSVFATLLFAGLLSTSSVAQADSIPVPQPRPTELAQAVIVTTPGNVYSGRRIVRGERVERRGSEWNRGRHGGWRNSYRGRVAKRTVVRHPDGRVTTTTEVRRNRRY